MKEELAKLLQEMERKAEEKQKELMKEKRGGERHALYQKRNHS